MKIRLDVVYKPKKDSNQYQLKSDFLPIQEALILGEDIEKTGRTVKIDYIDDTEVSWLRKNLLKYLESLKEEPNNLVVYFDGGFNKEKKLSGIGIVIYFEQNEKYYRLRKNQLLDQLESNNEAEFAALWVAVSELEELGVHHLPVTIKGDSLVVINPAKGEWPCYEKAHIRWLDRIEEKIARLGLNVTFDAISRVQNKEADQLASQALTGTVINATSELKKK